MPVATEEEEDNRLTQKIARVLDEARASNATHLRKLKDMAALRSSSSSLLRFFALFSKTLTPLFNFHRRAASAERIVRFVAIFASTRDEKCAADCDAFLEEFLRFLVRAAGAANKTARFRACQVISEIIMRLPDDTEVSDELWDEVIDSMKVRVGDRVPVIRTFAVRALSRFANDSENSDVLELFLQTLPLEQNPDVRKTIILSLPPTNASSAAIISCTLDASESVRKAAYCVLASKFPLQSLSLLLCHAPPSHWPHPVSKLRLWEEKIAVDSIWAGIKWFRLSGSSCIKLRTIILQRGLADRSTGVAKECLKLMKDEWLVKCCNGDPLELLKYLDVETYELVGESVMGSLLKAGLVKVQDGQSIKQFLASTNNTTEGCLKVYIWLFHCSLSINIKVFYRCHHWISGNRVQLMEAEVALYWRTVCKHLQTEALAKGSDAAMTMGTEAAVYAAEASDKNDLLERILPAAVSEYVELVKAHIVAGPNYRFTSRQLLLLGAMLDFSDATNRKVAGAFVNEMLHRPLEHEFDEDGNKVMIGDGIHFGGDKDWADAVSGLARKVHAVQGEFEEVVLRVVEELAQPCRERTADFMQWMHCLSVTGLILENINSFRWMQGKSAELLQSLLLPGAKHIQLDVQRVSVRCLGLFGLLERKPSEELIKQLRFSFVKGPSPVSTMACKALIDLGMWHGPQEVDKAMNRDLLSQLRDNAVPFHPVKLCDSSEDLNIELLDLLYARLEGSDRCSTTDADENESVQSVLGEGFAKILLLSEKYQTIPASAHPLIFAKVISLYFCTETTELQRLKQCLSVFFEHYPSLSVNHKASNIDSTTGCLKCICKAFIPVMRSMWPGINGKAAGSPVMVSNMRKRAVQVSRFMLQLIQAPLYAKETEQVDENGSNNSPEAMDDSVDVSDDFEYGEEGLAIRIAAEAASFHSKKTAAERSYLSAISRILFLLQFRPSEQGAVKLMRRLLKRVAESVSAEKELVKELKRMAERLRAVEKDPDQELLPDEAHLILERLELELNLNEDESREMPPTPAPRSVRPTRARGRARHVEESSSDDEVSPTSVVPNNPGTMSTRSQRASKTAAMTKMTIANRAIRVNNDDEDIEEVSEVTSEDDSDESDVSLE
ncbi:hypothetical protein RJ640_003801 [Escallonia rubra]|uniref:Nuclear condensin complex subunit 3 C-terminal domain-containing protein n=1 Tax=Escallonia rubra TaxID=112253 RepID=A0AA88URK3_9ASTE|nr:hypothetical protein RJ640_003801 [Escallonia rubra]